MDKKFKHDWHNVGFLYIPATCLAGHQLHNGTCYRFYKEREVFFAEAESYCNKLKNGHVAAYHSQEDFSFLDDLIGWVSLTVHLKKPTGIKALTKYLTENRK